MQRYAKQHCVCVRHHFENQNRRRLSLRAAFSVQLGIPFKDCQDCCSAKVPDTPKLLAKDAMSDSSDCTACGSSKSPVAEADTESSKVSPPTELDLARCGSGGARNDELGLPSLMKSSESSLALEPATPEAPLGSTLVTGALWLDPSSTSSIEEDIAQSVGDYSSSALVDRVVCGTVESIIESIIDQRESIESIKLNELNTVESV